MLNISPYDIKNKVNTEAYRSFQLFKDRKPSKTLSKLLIITFAVLLTVSFLPWTQNIRAVGNVTALDPSTRPQFINSVIDGRVEAWYIREGQKVNKGDTLLFLSEIKQEYLDPRLIERTNDQLNAKKQSLDFYQEKVLALDNQIAAIKTNRNLKLEQADNYIMQSILKIAADSIAYEAAIIDFTIAERQLLRQETLYDEGIKSLTDLEMKRMKMQETLSKKIGSESKLLSSRNELLNAQIEKNSVYNEYTDKFQKARSEQYSTQSAFQDTRVEVTKMENQLTNYQLRAGYYYVTAPQTGYITQAVTTGIGENIKAGDPLISIMPINATYAVEIYVKPQDLPLVHIGEEVRIIFDGWPSIIFSGWPIISYGTFSGEVVAIDRMISNKGKYRVLIGPSGEEGNWPEALRVGAGANGLALLEDVPVWYEIWRQINGFPPNYYLPEGQEGDDMKAMKNK
jgi:multidrug resistance efflux pump